MGIVIRMRVFHLSIGCALLCGSATPLPAQTGDIRGVHDPCLIKAGDTYVLFATGRGIPMRRSSDLEKWSSSGRVFEEIPEWCAREVPGFRGWIWAPDISYFNGRYHLYYSVSTFGRNRSCIGLAVNKTLDAASKDYLWIDLGKVVESQPGRDDWNAIDPALAVDESGAPWLAFGSFWSGIKMRRIDPASGLVSSEDSTLYALASRPGKAGVEAPFLIRREGWHYLFVSFDICCRGVDSTYRIMVGRSKKITGPYMDREGRPMLDGGGTELLASHGSMRGPGHNAVLAEQGRHWLVHHYYDAEDRERSRLRIAPLRWTSAGWPETDAGGH
jgi:arabinan endo-1,5-alpha-L-arabinosidase